MKRASVISISEGMRTAIQATCKDCKDACSTVSAREQSMSLSSSIPSIPSMMGRNNPTDKKAARPTIA